jgi:hypothetical protein
MKKVKEFPTFKIYVENISNTGNQRTWPNVNPLCYYWQFRHYAMKFQMFWHKIFKFLKQKLINNY